LEQLNQQNRHLRTQLETEKTEKQFAPDEIGELSFQLNLSSATAAAA